MRNRFEKMLLTVGLVLTATGAVRAQHPGHHDAAGIQAALLTNKSVQKELKLDGAQSEKVKTLANDVAAKGRAAVAKFKDLPESERREKMHELMTATCADAMTTLRGVLTAEQFKRYEQIVLQQRGMMAFADSEIQKNLKLTDVQKGRLHNLANDFHGQMRELSQSVSPANMAEVHEQGTAVQRKALDHAVAALSAEQKVAWKELVGEPFEVKFEGHPASVTQ
jgi:LTXXQ motif family protein